MYQLGPHAVSFMSIEGQVNGDRRGEKTEMHFPATESKPSFLYLTDTQLSPWIWFYMECCALSS